MMAGQGTNKVSSEGEIREIRRSKTRGAQGTQRDASRTPPIMLNRRWMVVNTRPLHEPSEDIHVGSMNDVLTSMEAASCCLPSTALFVPRGLTLRQPNYPAETKLVLAMKEDLQSRARRMVAVGSIQCPSPQPRGKPQSPSEFTFWVNDAKTLGNG